VISPDRDDGPDRGGPSWADAGSPSGLGLASFVDGSALGACDALEEGLRALGGADYEPPPLPAGLSWWERARARRRLGRLAREHVERDVERSLTAQADRAALARTVRALNQVIGLRLAYERLFNPLPPAVETVLSRYESIVVGEYLKLTAGQGSLWSAAADEPLSAFTLTREELAELARAAGRGAP
jgi:hypothetical protein